MGLCRCGNSDGYPACDRSSCYDEPRRMIEVEVRRCTDSGDWKYVLTDRGEVVSISASRYPSIDAARDAAQHKYPHAPVRIVNGSGDAA